jgi:hypothetical protein
LSILLHGDLYLDPFVPTYFGYDAANGTVNQRLQHSASFRHGHWVSNYPMVIPILIAPLYVPLAWCIHHYHLALNRPAAVRLIDLTEKVSSAVIGSLAAAFLFLCLQHLTRRTIALGLTLLYALASNTWVIGSQALWQHGMSELLIAVCLWSLVVAEERPAFLLVSGIGAALATANRPPNVIFATIVLVYVVFRHRGNAWRYLVAPAVIAPILLAWNYYYFASMSGGYVGQAWSTPMMLGLVGILFSPSRGLFVYTPWTVFAFIGVVLVLVRSAYPVLYRYLALVVIAETLLYSKWWCWWGGWCFGPRMLTDILPLLTILLIPVVDYLAQAPALRAAFIAAAILSFGVQMIGAYLHIDQAMEPQRLWSWRDSQLVEAVRMREVQSWSLYHVRGPLGNDSQTTGISGDGSR